MRLEAAGLFAEGIRPLEVARRLRVSRKSAYQWHRAWQEGGVEVLASRGLLGKRCKLSPRMPGNSPSTLTRALPRMGGAKTRSGRAREWRG
ncbi:helix-turn-helix domain-containing protein [Streptomyces lavendulocolor]